MLPRSKITAEINFPIMVAKANIKWEFDFEKNINDVINMWKNDDTKSFSEQTVELNEMLKDYKIYIFIDEVDRLQSSGNPPL